MYPSRFEQLVLLPTRTCRACQKCPEKKILNVREVVKEFGFGWKKVDAMQHAISNKLRESVYNRLIRGCKSSIEGYRRRIS
jgi:hypothetical protein